MFCASILFIILTSELIFVIDFLKTMSSFFSFKINGVVFSVFNEDNYISGPLAEAKNG